MRMTLEGEEGELESKKPEIVRALFGDGYSLVKSEIPESFYQAQKENLSFWDKKFKQMLEDIKGDIHEIIGP